MTQDKRFEGKTVLITGGARGQGAAEAVQIASEGGRVVIGDILDEQGKQLAATVGEKASYVHLDVTSEQDWRSLIRCLEEKGTGLHGLVNNAAIYEPLPMRDTSVALLEKHFRVNQLGCFLGMREVSPLIEASGGGAIVNISSVAGMRGSRTCMAYSATKWALRGMTKCAALELAPAGVRVNSIHPGWVDTEMLLAEDPSDRERQYALIPLKRAGTVDEVADLVLFLLSNESRYITGAEIAIDGGLLL
ncbi:SDR family oxidoreductase [Aminobacter sp. BA135]|uniref:SDR family NAD(P)-dependent oxidoreductase n=1 Tax=Aminobacter sp. BA135 TaxID=537596 RepID=UPI003D7ABFF7